MKLTDDNLYITYILENRTQRELMQIFGLTRRQVQFILKEAGLRKHSEVPEEFVRLYEKGLTYAELAEYFDVDYSLITSWRRRMNVRKSKVVRARNSKMPDDDMLYTLRILEEKKIKDIATMYGVATTTVASWLQRAELVNSRKYIIPNKEQLQRDYENATGDKREWIAKKYGVGNGTVAQWLHRNGIKREERPLITREECVEAIDMRLRGVKPKDITDHFSINHSSLIRYMHDYGLFDRWNNKG